MSKMKRFYVTITGERPMLLHADDIEFSERVKAWQTESDNSAKSVKGDDRSPAWTWIGSLYSDSGKLVMPSDNLMTMLREGGKRVATGKRGGSFKAQSQACLMLTEASWPLLVNGREIPFSPIAALGHELDFRKHLDVAKQLGFELHVKRARVGKMKHIRVRPMFSNWSCSGEVIALDDTITQKVLTQMLAQAGRFAGLGDWRPSAPSSPGGFGVFTATVKDVSDNINPIEV